jgi:hypothetical protein
MTTEPDPVPPAGRDGAPAVTIAPFEDRRAPTSLPCTVTLTGTTSDLSDTQVGVTGVAYAFGDGPSGPAQDTSPGGDWSAWQVQALLTAFGTYPFTVTATNAVGSTTSVSDSISLTPQFTWVAPADGAVVHVRPGGAQVEVQLTPGPDQLLPVTVSIEHDGLEPTTELCVDQYSKTITLAPAPLGPRFISVTCTDSYGLASTQTRSVVAYDGAPPTVTIAPFDDNRTVTELPYPVTLTGTTSGAQSGVTGVAYAFTNGPSGPAQDTSPGGDWSAWQVRVPLNTTGSYPFTITATDFAGSTGSASGTITLHL